MPTRQSWLTIATGGLTLVVGRLFALPELFILGTALVACVVLAIVLVSTRNIRVSVERAISPLHPRAGETLDVDLEFTTESRTPPCEIIERLYDDGSIRMSLAALPAGKQIRTSYRRPTTERGPVTLGPATIKFFDPLGLSHKSTTLGRATKRLVLPRSTPINLPEIGTCSGDLVEAIRRITGSQPSSLEFRSIREYSPGDDPRRVNWKASAKRDIMVINEFETESLIDMQVALDTRRSAFTPAGFERAVSTVASFVDSCAYRTEERNIVVSLSLGDRIFAQVDSSSSLAALEHLASIQVDSESSPRSIQRDPSRIKVDVIVVGLVDPEWVRSTWIALGSARIVVLVACDEGESMSSSELPPHWFRLGCPNIESFAEGWHHLSRRTAPAVVPA